MFSLCCLTETSDWLMWDGPIDLLKENNVPTVKETESRVRKAFIFVHNFIPTLYMFLTPFLAPVTNI